MNDDKSLSQGNVEFIREMVEKYLNEQKRHEKSVMGYITLKEKIVINKNEKRFKNEFRSMYDAPKDAESDQI